MVKARGPGCVLLDSDLEARGICTHETSTPQPSEQHLHNDSTVSKLMWADPTLEELLRGRISLL